MSRHALMAALLVLAGGIPAQAADLAKVERRIVKEPKYKSASPRYVLLAIGPEAKDRVWIVKDGDTLYVDRNGNGDLTDPGEKIAADKGGSALDGYSFEIDELTVGGKKHYRLNVSVAPLKVSVFGADAQRADVKAVLAKDPKAEILRLHAVITLPHLKAKGQVGVVAGSIALDGPLVMTAKAAEAPIIHFGGPLALTFLSDIPTLRRERPTQFTLAVGTPGLGTGTFAMICYEDVIPTSVHPSVAVAYPPPKEGLPPVEKLYELKNRC